MHHPANIVCGLRTYALCLHCDAIGVWIEFLSIGAAVTQSHLYRLRAVPWDDWREMLNVGPYNIRMTQYTVGFSFRIKRTASLG